MTGLEAADQALLAALAARAPRVQCLMNQVAQPLGANALLAIGAEPSMAMHPAEIVGMARGAGALLINLGTFDAAREAAIEALLAAHEGILCPVVIDPVFVHRSPIRLGLARRLMAFSRLIVKGNEAEMACLAPDRPKQAVFVTSGRRDRIDSSAGSSEITGGDPLMARVSGTGCALGAAIAAFAAMTDDDHAAAMAALRLFKAAAEVAAGQSAGPGSFAPAFLDALHRFSARAAAPLKAQLKAARA